MNFYISLLFLFSGVINSHSQEITPESNVRNGITIGLEQDVLPYLLRGFIVTGWMGRDYSRVRFSYAQVTSPSFFIPKTIFEDKVRAFGISYEFFFKDEYKGWWVGPGVGYWTNYLKTSDGITFKNESVIFSLGGGYNYFLTSWLYVSP